MEQDLSMLPYESSPDILQDMRGIIETARDRALQAVNLALVQRNWLLGRRIAEAELLAEIEAQKAIFYLQQKEQLDGCY